MVAVVVTYSPMVDAAQGMAQPTPPAQSGHPAAQMQDLEGSARLLDPARGLVVAVAVSLGLWGLLFAVVRLVVA